MKAIVGTAKTIERRSHFKFCRWIKKGKFIGSINVFKAAYFHAACIKEYIGITTVVNVLQEFRFQDDMYLVAYLHRIFVRLSERFSRFKCSQYLPGFKGYGCMQRFFSRLIVLVKCCKSEE